MFRSGLYMQGSENSFKMAFRLSDVMKYSRCGPSLFWPFLKQNFTLLPPRTIKRSMSCQEPLVCLLIAWAAPEAEQTQAGRAVLTVTNLTVFIIESASSFPFSLSLIFNCFSLTVSHRSPDRIQALLYLTCQKTPHQ